MEVIVMKIARKEAGSVVARVIRTSVGPLAGDSLDEPFGLSIGLWAVGSCEAVLDAHFLAGEAKSFER